MSSSLDWREGGVIYREWGVLKLFFKEKRCEVIVPCTTFSDLSGLLSLDVDGCYFGIRGWSRSDRDLEFSVGDLSELTRTIHQRDKQALLSFNLMSGPFELDQAYTIVKEAIKRDIDGVICSDPALAIRIKEEFPSVEIHASLGAAIISQEEAAFWADLGADRVVLSPHLDVEEVEEISKEMEKREVVTEVMVFGMRCEATLLGICRLSSYFDMNLENAGLRSVIWTGSPKRSGVCYRSCAQEWRECSGKEWHWSPKPYWDIELVSDLLQAGVGAFKIGGRGIGLERMTKLVRAIREKMEEEESYV